VSCIKDSSDTGQCPLLRGGKPNPWGNGLHGLSSGSSTECAYQCYKLQVPQNFRYFLTSWSTVAYQDWFWAVGVIYVKCVKIQKFSENQCFYSLITKLYCME